MKMNLDIIIPAYNAKDTIKKTLDSIAMQKKIKEVHVYLINDNSEYNYKEFVELYNNKMNLKEIILKRNVGPGVARNKGIEIGTGKYIMFIDSDDCLYKNNVLEKMYNKIEKENSDLLISNFIYERDNQTIVKKMDPIWLHGKMYRRCFLEKNQIRFNKTRANEDNGFNRLILLLNPKISVLDDITYVYCNNLNSITRKNGRIYKLEGLEGFAYNMIWAMDEALKRGCCENDIKILSLNTLIAMYYYYLPPPRSLPWATHADCIDMP